MHRKMDDIFSGKKDGVLNGTPSHDSRKTLLQIPCRAGTSGCTECRLFNVFMLSVPKPIILNKTLIAKLL